MRSPPFGACWLTVSKTPSHGGAKDVENWLQCQILGNREAEALENRVGCATRNEREKEIGPHRGNEMSTLLVLPVRKLRPGEQK